MNQIHCTPYHEYNILENSSELARVWLDLTTSGLLDQLAMADITTEVNLQLLFT